MIASLPDTLVHMSQTTNPVPRSSPYAIHKAAAALPKKEVRKPANAPAPFRKQRTSSQCGFCAQYGHDKESCLFMAKLVHTLKKLGFKIKNQDAKSLASKYELSNKASRDKVVRSAKS